MAFFVVVDIFKLEVYSRHRIGEVAFFAVVDIFKFEVYSGGSKKKEKFRVRGVWEAMGRECTSLLNFWCPKPTRFLLSTGRKNGNTPHS